MKICCIGRNYVAHAKELGNEVPTDPVVFLKPDSALVEGELSAFDYPAFTSDLHYECELVLKIGKQCKDISVEGAIDCVAAISAGIDFTARDIQQQLKTKGLPWEKAKGFDQSAIVGKWMPLPALMPILFSLIKNGEKVQEGTTENMIFDFATIISHVSQYFTLQPGDLIFTGTPAGVGPVAKGDVLEGFIGNEKMFTLQVK
jgi:2-keto-4-pentenoate hydratase/2-oxohepta-3-ene-1,7-dioic acid hydratase in catechol pathway